MMSFATTQDKIMEALPSLSTELRKAARFLLDHPDEVALVSMRVLASRSEVTPTTFVRLARRLGFDDWAQLREPFKNRLRSGSSPYATKADALVPRSSRETIFAESVNATAANIKAVATTNSTHDVLAACVLLEKARGVRVVGFRSCRAPAHCLVYLCRMFRNDVTLLGSDGGALEAELASLDSGEAVVAIGFQPYSRELGLVTDVARRRGVPVLAIVDSMAAPLTRDADLTLRFSVDSPSFFPSVAAAVATVEALAATLLTRSGAKGATKVRQTEAELTALGAYMPD